MRTRPLAILAATMLLIVFAGCSDDSTNAPDPQPPTMPDAAGLGIDLTFFDGGSAKAIGQDHFFNAYLRAVIVSALTDLVLAPPVGAFALAVNSVPTLQPDGSWLWVYTDVHGAEETQIRLRGQVDGDTVAWWLWVDDELWFDGTTQDDGDIGTWTFYDFTLPGKPPVAALEWHDGAGHDELRLEVLHGESAGDALTFAENGDQCRIDYDDASSDSVWFIRWNEADGTGGLCVPEYNGGAPACWDEQHYDVECPVS